MGENIQVGNEETKSNGMRNQVTPPYIAETMRSLSVELWSYRADNESLIKSQEE